jgi:hypothetical protein
LLTAFASIAGGWATTPGPAGALRALEGLGFLLGALAGAGLIRRLVPASDA